MNENVSYRLHTKPEVEISIQTEAYIVAEKLIMAAIEGEERLKHELTKNGTLRIGRMNTLFSLTEVAISDSSRAYLLIDYFMIRVAMHTNGDASGRGLIKAFEELSDLVYS